MCSGVFILERRNPVKTSNCNGFAGGAMAVRAVQSWYKESRKKKKDYSDPNRYENNPPESAGGRFSIAGD
jgi:hypothetical protein